MKYIDADKLIAEIKRLEEMDYPCDTLEQSAGFYDAIDRIKSFIASLVEFEHRRKDTIYFLETAKTHYADTSELEKCIEWLKGLQPTEGIKGNLEEIPSNVDLEKAAEEYADKHGFRVPYDGSNNFYDDVDVKASLEGFKAGAEWQKKYIKR